MPESDEHKFTMRVGVDTRSEDSPEELRQEENDVPRSRWNTAAFLSNAMAETEIPMTRPTAKSQHCTKLEAISCST